MRLLSVGQGGHGRCNTGPHLGSTGNGAPSTAATPRSIGLVVATVVKARARNVIEIRSSFAKLAPYFPTVFKDFGSEGALCFMGEHDDMDRNNAPWSGVFTATLGPRSEPMHETRTSRPTQRRTAPRASRRPGLDRNGHGQVSRPEGMSKRLG